MDTHISNIYPLLEADKVNEHSYVFHFKFQDADSLSHQSRSLEASGGSNTVSKRLYHIALWSEKLAGASITCTPSQFGPNEIHIV